MKKSKINSRFQITGTIHNNVGRSAIRGGEAFAFKGETAYSILETVDKRKFIIWDGSKAGHEICHKIKHGSEITILASLCQGYHTFKPEFYLELSHVKIVQ